MYKIGDVIDDFTVLSYEGQNKNYVKLFKVKCNICGYEKVVQYARLNAHITTFHNNKTCKYVKSKDKNIGLIVNDYMIIARTNRHYKRPFAKHYG